MGRLLATFRKLICSQLVLIIPDFDKQYLKIEKQKNKSKILNKNKTQGPNAHL